MRKCRAPACWLLLEAMGLTRKVQNVMEEESWPI